MKTNNMTKYKSFTDEILEPDPSWPQFGMIEMRNVFMRYDLTEPYILRNLNFTILPKEKVKHIYVYYKTTIVDFMKIE